LARCTEVDSGARNIDHILSGTVLPQLASHLLSYMVDGKTPSHIHMTVSLDDQIHYELTDPTSTAQAKVSTKSKVAVKKKTVQKTTQQAKVETIENA
jgi:type VI secretion system protein VasG